MVHRPSLGKKVTRFQYVSTVNLPGLRIEKCKLKIGCWLSKELIQLIGYDRPETFLTSVAMWFVVVVQPHERGIVLTEELARFQVLHMPITKDHVEGAGVAAAGRNSRSLPYACGVGVVADARGVAGYGRLIAEH